MKLYKSSAYIPLFTFYCPEVAKVVPSLGNIANEIIDDIVAYLTVKDQHTVLLTSRCLHDVTARQLYRRVDVTHYHARKFFKTISESDQDYRRYIRALTFSSSCGIEMRITYVLMLQAIPFFIALQELTLRIRPGLSPFLLFVLRKEQVNPNVLDKEDANDPLACPSVRPCQRPGFDILPCLHTLKIHGDIRLLRLASMKNLTNISLTTLLDMKDMAFFISLCGQGYDSNDNITHLTLSVNYTLGEKISATIYCLGQAFPKVTTLTLRSPSINALDVSQVLTLDPPLFTNLQELLINDWSTLEPMYILPREESLELQERHVTHAGNTRASLRLLQFASIYWRRGGQDKHWGMTTATTPELTIEAAAESSLERPLFWDVDYDEPSPLSSLDTDVLSTSSDSEDSFDG